MANRRVFLIDHHENELECPDPGPDLPYLPHGSDAVIRSLTVQRQKGEVVPGPGGLPLFNDLTT